MGTYASRPVRWRLALTGWLLVVVTVLQGVGAVSAHAATAEAGTFRSLVPTRILDTRTATGATGPVGPGATITVQVTGRGGVPTGAAAVALNLTVTETKAAGYITAYPTGATLPNTSNLNYAPGQTIPNHAIVKLSTDGRLTLKNTSTGTAHLIADIAGYFTAGSPDTPGAFGALPPARVLDTRTATGATGPVGPGATITVQVTGRGGVPTGAAAVALNLTVTETKAAGYITAYPTGATLPNTSNLNYAPGQTIPNHAIVKLSTDGRLTLKNTSTGTAHLIADIAGYFTAGSPSFADGSSLWLPYWQQSAAVATASSTTDLFGTANLFWYDATSCSNIVGYPGAGDSAVVASLRGHGLKVVATVTASGLLPAEAIACLGDPARRAAHIEKLASLATSGGLDGIDINYEQLAETTDAAVALRVRAAFTAFGTELCSRLSALDKSCYLTVMPRTDDSLAVWRGSLIPGVYDYAPLAEAATHLRVMAYDQHAYDYGPGPMAGLPWVKQVMAYAESKADRAKLELGVPDYGRDFSGGTHRAAEGDTPVTRAAQYGVTPLWDATQAEYTYAYSAGGVQHVVWYSGPDAVALRYALGEERGWAGACVWAAASEVSGTWTAVRAR